MKRYYEKCDDCPRDSRKEARFDCRMHEKLLCEEHINLHLSEMEMDYGALCYIRLHEGYSEPF